MIAGHLQKAAPVRARMAGTAYAAPVTIPAQTGPGAMRRMPGTAERPCRAVAPRPIQVIDTATPILGTDYTDCTSFRAIAIAARKAPETRGQPDRRHTR